MVDIERVRANRLAAHLELNHILKKALKENSLLSDAFEQTAKEATKMNKKEPS